MGEIRERARIEVAKELFENLPSLVKTALEAINGNNEKLSPKEAVDVLRVVLSILRVVDPLAAALDMPLERLLSEEVMEILSDESLQSY